MVSSYQGTASAISRVNSPTNIHCDTDLLFCVPVVENLLAELALYNWFCDLENRVFLSSLKYDYVRQKSNKEKIENYILSTPPSNLFHVPLPPCKFIASFQLFLFYIYIYMEKNIYVMYSCVNITS